jgi:hypothetical protein
MADVKAIYRVTFFRLINSLRATDDGDVEDFERMEEASLVRSGVRSEAIVK